MGFETPKIGNDLPTSEMAIKKAFGNKEGDDNYLTVDQISALRAGEFRNGSYKGQRYQMGDIKISVLRNPIILKEDIENEEHRKRIFSLLEKKEGGEIANNERLLANILFEQAKIAKAFQLPMKAMYLSVKLNYIENHKMMMDNFGFVYMQVLERHIDWLKERGATAEQVMTELSGHLFHEAVHQSGEEGMDIALLDGKASLGEVTSITSQLAYYFEKGYFGPKCYDNKRLVKGVEKIRNNENSLRDHDVATYVAVFLLLKSLEKTFPEFCESSEKTTAMDKCEEILKRIPSERKKDLLPCLKEAIKQSADEKICEEIIKQAG